MSEDTRPVLQASSPHELIVQFLARECKVEEKDFDDLSARMIQWASANPAKAAVNEFSPIMLLEQCRREFDESVDFVIFALAAADMQWGPRMIKLGQWEKPVWVIALEGFPAMIEAARQAVQKQGDAG